MTNSEQIKQKDKRKMLNRTRERIKSHDRRRQDEKMRIDGGRGGGRMGELVGRSEETDRKTNESK